ncbi:hypothetical protein TNCV_4603421 [Trichonephila clavipes]|nr:hypothetical protein TNCV_4603421 [Trichonephila clavipes]
MVRVSLVRVLLPLNNRQVECLMHMKCAENQCPSLCGVCYSKEGGARLCFSHPALVRFQLGMQDPWFHEPDAIAFR